MKDLAIGAAVLLGGLWIFKAVMTPPPPPAVVNRVRYGYLSTGAHRRLGQRYL